MKKEQVAIGLDIGGTKIRAGIVDRQGCVRNIPTEILTCAQQDRAIITNNLAALVQQILQDTSAYEVLGIGVGCTGPLDNDRGVILDVVNLPTLNHFPLKDFLEQQFATKVVMDNDANALILGEAVFGAGRGYDSVLGITLGTGLGCAFVADGKIWQGNNGCAGEIWTSPYKEGLIEDYVSGSAIANIYKYHTGVGYTALDIANMARQGDSVAIRIWNSFADDLAYALSWIVNMTDPQSIVMGGSVSKSADLFMDRVDTTFRQYVCTSVADSVVFKSAQLGDDAGIIGAALFMFNSEV